MKIRNLLLILGLYCPKSSSFYVFDPLIVGLMGRIASYKSLQQRYACSAPINAAVAEHAHELIQGQRYVGQKDWLPGYVIKGDAENRIKGREKMEWVLKNNPSLNLIRLPEKCICSMPSSGNVAVARCVGTFGNLRIQKIVMTPEQVKQLCDFIMAVGWSDSHAENFIIHDGVIYIIDTENKYINPGLRLAGIVGLWRLLHTNSLDENSIKYIRNRLSYETKNYGVRNFFFFDFPQALITGHMSGIAMLLDWLFYYRYQFLEHCSKGT